MQRQFTFDQILEINFGNKEDADRIISIYLTASKLIQMNNSQFDGYLSETLEEDDLRLRSSLDRFSETSSKITSIWNVFALLIGWVAFILTQLLDINVIDIIKEWTNT